MIICTAVWQKCNGISTQRFRKVKFLKSAWDLLEREEVTIGNNSHSDLVCAIKCSMTPTCSGSTYHKSSGLCEMGKVIVIT